MTRKLTRKTKQMKLMIITHKGGGVDNNDLPHLTFVVMIVSFLYLPSHLCLFKTSWIAWFGFDDFLNTI